MSRKKCCVNGCESTRNTHKLFCMPKNDNLRNLWMSFLVPTTPCLLLLSKDQLLTKRVCQKHFDETQFDVMGERIRYSYPCLFTEDEFFHGVPLRSDEYNVLQEHNYFNYRESADGTPTGEPTVLMGMPGNVPSLEHVYGLPLSSQAGAKLRNEGVSISSVSLAAISEKENIEMELFLASQPSTSKGNSDSKTPLTDISQIINIETEEIYKGMPKQIFSKDDGIEIAGRKLFIIHDAPLLLKGIRNNFIDKDILYDGKRASWQDILYIYDLDNKSGHTRAFPKLTADHVDPKKMKKMKVKVAAQVLSARTAAMLNYTDALHRRLGNPRETMKTTAEAVLFFDELFDSVNGSPGQSRGKMRCAVRKTFAHMEFWLASLKKLIEIKYIDTKSKLAVRTGKPRFVRVPSLEGWITTLKSFLGLATLLFNQYNVEYFYPRLINQDPLENFFGRIRAFNYRNVNPDVNAFVYTFKSLVINSILMPQSKFANCEDDEGDTLIDFNYLFTSAKVDKEISQVSNRFVPSSSSQSDPQELTVKM